MEQTETLEAPRGHFSQHGWVARSVKHLLYASIWWLPMVVNVARMLKDACFQNVMYKSMVSWPKAWVEIDFSSPERRFFRKNSTVLDSFVNKSIIIPPAGKVNRQIKDNMKHMLCKHVSYEFTSLWTIPTALRDVVHGQYEQIDMYNPIHCLSRCQAWMLGLCRFAPSSCLAINRCGGASVRTHDVPCNISPFTQYL